MDGRPVISSASVSAGVLNETLSLEYLHSLSVRDRDVLVNDGMPANAGVIDLRPCCISGMGGGDNDMCARSSAAFSPLERFPGVDAAFRTV